MRRMEKIRLGRCVLEFSSNGNLTDDCLTDFLHGISAIDHLVVRGLVSDLHENLSHINNKIQEAGVFVGKIETEIMI